MQSHGIDIQQDTALSLKSLRLSAD